WIVSDVLEIEDPPGVVTAIAPLDAPDGTTNESAPSLQPRIVALVDPSAIDDEGEGDGAVIGARSNPDPSMKTTSPTEAVDGENAVIFGFPSVTQRTPKAPLARCIDAVIVDAPVSALGSRSDDHDAPTRAAIARSSGDAVVTYGKVRRAGVANVVPA